MSKTTTRHFFFKKKFHLRGIFNTKKVKTLKKKKSSGKPTVRHFLDAFLKSKNEKDYSRELFPKKFQARKFSKQKLSKPQKAF